MARTEDSSTGNDGGAVPAITSTIRSFFESIAGSTSDPTNPVVNGTTAKSAPFLARLLADIASQAPRLGENVALIHSLVDTKLFDGGIVDDRQYQVSQNSASQSQRTDDCPTVGEDPAVGCFTSGAI